MQSSTRHEARIPFKFLALQRPATARSGATQSGTAATTKWNPAGALANLFSPTSASPTTFCYLAKRYPTCGLYWHTRSQQRNHMASTYIRPRQQVLPAKPRPGLGLPASQTWILQECRAQGS
eukprot:9482147-Pyramimonas_sp.AAC.1